MSESIKRPRRPETASAWPILRRSHEGHPVETLQHLLRGHGYPILVDGVFGPRTESAVRTLQTDEGLMVDGIVGRHTWPIAAPDLRRGSRGDAVRALQYESHLRAPEGRMPAVVIDGVFGPTTEYFVRLFRQSMCDSFPGDATEVGGSVDVVTWRALVGGFLL